MLRKKIKMRRWKCKKCGREYETPDAGEIRIEIPVEGWDFCPYDGSRRDEND